MDIKQLQMLALVTNCGDPMQIIKAKFQSVKAPFNRVNDAVSRNRMSANQPYKTLAISVYIKKYGVFDFFTCMLPQSENYGIQHEKIICWQHPFAAL